MVFGSTVAGRTRSRRGGVASSSYLGGVEKKKGGAFPLKSKVKEPFASKKSRNCSRVAGPGNRGESRHMARSPGDDGDDEVVLIEESASDSFVDMEYSLDESDNGLVQGSRSGSSNRVRAQCDSETPQGCVGGDNSVISIGSSSCSDEDGLCEDGEERLPDTDSGFEEFESSSESEADESDDEDFSSSGNRRSVEIKEEEETTGLRSDGLFLSHKVEQDVSDVRIIDIGSSDDDTDDNAGMSWLGIPGGVASRTRSKVGPRESRRETVGQASSLVSRGGSNKKYKPCSPLRKKAPNMNRKGGKRKQQSENLQGFDRMKNGVERDLTMLKSSVGHKGKQTAAANIRKLKNSNDGNGGNSNSCSSDHASNTGMVERAGSKSTRKLDFFEILAESILMKDGVQDKVQEQNQVKELLPLNFPWFDEEKPVEKSKSEDEMDELWRMMNLGLQANQIGSFSFRNEDQDIDSSELSTCQAALCRQGKHDLFLDDELGMRCRYCAHIEFEIVDYCPPFEKFQTPYKSYHRYQDSANLDGLEIQPSRSCHVDCFSPSLSGTVWDLIPESRNRMYPHQQEGFEFLWRNLGGSISLDDLRNTCLLKQEDIGGCIISHAPGTGKTRLTLVFLQSYLELYPDSCPVIVAPAGLLLTWEGEFRKWGIGVRFHNLNTELSGKEDPVALKMLDSHRLSRNTNCIRMVKLYSWCKTKSILVLSYDLFVKLTGESPQSSKEREHMREILIRQPGLVILDEGHIPRNRDSQVWNLMIKLETKKRVILSGTPFQNNFEELLNTLHLVRPKIAESIPRTLKKFCQRGPTAQIDGNPAEAIDKIKAVMAPFVHLHKGSILQESLPGLRDCVVVLNPSDLQMEVLRTFHRVENDSEVVGRKRKEINVFGFEHKQALISVHPSLALSIEFSPGEKSFILKEEMLKVHELNPGKGAKTRFLKELLQLCLKMDEKVLVFSQYIKPLHFIARQLGKAFNWTEGMEVLIMVGDLRMNQRQSLINLFNDRKSDARVLLASTKACSEGINLVGASRVILLDVVWNPAVERQAISRAYRLGQERVVYTYHLIMKGTSEWEKYQKQVQKDRLSELVFSASTSDGDNSGKKLGVVSQDKILEEMTSHPKLRGLFDQIRYQPKQMDMVEHFMPTMEST